MHPNRRRKKRPNYGIRTVEVNRGSNGFGFTISGQQPCILSCIVNNSPADHAGLRAGDFLISVNGISVSKINHDAVVNLIGTSIGPIKMTIAENYYSDSSDEELEVSKMINSRKQKYNHKPRIHRLHKHALKNDHIFSVNSTKHAERIKECVLKHSLKQKFKANSSNKEEPTKTMNMSNSFGLMEDEAGPIEYKTLVGYLGTIEMPKQLLPNSRLQTVCSCIRKLRQEKRVPTAVLMTILPTCLTLKNSSNHILAIYPTNRVVYVGSATDKESRYFGLVTSAVCDTRDLWQVSKKTNAEPEIEISNSCHVFVTDPKLVDHSEHIKKAETFNIICTVDLITEKCLEFPKNSLYIVSLIQSMYRLEGNIPTVKVEDNHLLVANSPQPSASSNSDSGIGYRDDFGNVSDRILVVEFPSRHLPFSSNNINNSDQSNDANLNMSIGFNITSNGPDILNNDISQHVAQKIVKPNLDFAKPNDLFTNDRNVEAKCSNSINNIRAFENVNIKNILDKSKTEYCAKQNNDSNINRLTCRAIIVNSSVNNPNRNISRPTNNYENDRDRFEERSIDVENLVKKSYECLPSRIEHRDLRNSVDDLSVHSSKSIELGSIKSVFKTPSAAKFFDKKHKSQMKTVSSCDNIDRCDDDILKYKLSPKVYGMSKTSNYSCDELNNIQTFRDIGGYNSLNDFCFLSRPKKGKIVQSEPDVRCQRSQQDVSYLCDQNGLAKNSTQIFTSWATSFEKLLEDPVGLKTFTEFLKKEFSAENIDFWIACEKYRELSSGPEKRAEAQRIYEQHLTVGASEAVNVDAHGRQCVEQSLPDAPDNIFDQTQKQIFNLMKFDSYPRFLKTDLYKQSLSSKVAVSNATPVKLKKSLSNAEDRRRKSLLPWHRKCRSKSKDGFESEFTLKYAEITGKQSDSDFKTNGSDIHSSRSSLTSLDLASSLAHESGKRSQDEISFSGRTALCRVILGNDSTTVVQIKEPESILQLVQRLLEKRGLTYSSFEVFTNKHVKPLNINDFSSKLAGCEVRIQQRVVFKIDLPNHRVVSVKSKASKMIVDVLKPILHKYDYTLGQVKVIRIDTNETLNVHQPITSIDGAKLSVQLTGGITSTDDNTPHSQKIPSRANRLVEITNQVFEDILQEKSEAVQRASSDRGSAKSEASGSEHSSGILGKFLRKDSSVNDRKKSFIPRSKLLANAHHFESGTSENPFKKPLVAKLKAGDNKLQVSPSSESDELVEGLTRAQKSRLEDQRGTEINFELPDFLKDKENEEKDSDDPTSAVIDKLSVAAARSLKPETKSPDYENHNTPMTNSDDVLNPHSPQKFNNLRIFSPNKFSVGNHLAAGQISLSKTLDNLRGKSEIGSSPPPLPPKPKIIPLKPSNWGQNGFYKPREINSNERNNNQLFLEQPSSSFV